MKTTKMKHPLPEAETQEAPKRVNRFETLYGLFHVARDSGASVAPGRQLCGYYRTLEDAVASVASWRAYHAASPGESNFYIQELEVEALE